MGGRDERTPAARSNQRTNLQEVSANLARHKKPLVHLIRTPITSKRCATRRCWSQPRPSEATSASSRNGNHDARRNRRAGASNRQDTNKAARRRLQPTRRSSPRGRPRATTIIACAGQFQCCRRAPVATSHRVFPIPIRSSMPPCSGRSRPSLAVAAQNAASLDRPCARRLRDGRSGRKNAGGAVKPKNKLAGGLRESGSSQKTACPSHPLFARSSTAMVAARRMRTTHLRLPRGCLQRLCGAAAICG